MVRFEAFRAFMSSKIYLIFLGVHILIIIVNYNLLKNPKPYPPEEIRKEFKSGGESLASYKYVAYPITYSQDLLKANQIGKMEIIFGINQV